jgi:hypothetical protein
VDQDPVAGTHAVRSEQADVDGAPDADDVDFGEVVAVG